MYYHILIETNEKIGKSKTNKTIYEVDRVNKDELLEDVVTPFVNKKDFQFNGYFLKPSDIVRLVIKTTEKSARDISQYENSNLDPGIIMYISPEDIVSYDKYTIDVTKQLLSEAKMIKEVDIHSAATKSQKAQIDKTKVFIVHGQDIQAKVEVARFVEKIGFEAIILHEQANKGKTIIEKIEEYTNVGFAVVLYTPCDIGGLKSSNEMNPRARQNVVFEHGYLTAKIGRNNVCALIKDNLEKPNDISGLVYIVMDSNNGWQLALAKEMKSAGYIIDFNLIL